MSSRKTPSYITRPYLVVFAFFAVFFFLLYQMARILAPFSGALIWAAILALALYPVYRKVLKLLGNREGYAAAAMTFAALLLVIGPAIAFLVVLTGQAVDLYEWASKGIRSGAFTQAWNGLADAVSRKALDHPLLAGLDIKGSLISGIGKFSSSLATQIGGLLRDTVVLAFNLLMMLVALFFFFRNGRSYYEAVMDLLPFTREQEEAIARKLHDTFSAVINGVFLVSLGQGIVTGIGLAVFGVPFAAFWGFFAFILALLPIVGAAGVWLPAAFYLFLTGAKLKAVLLAVWGVVLVSVPDNFLKPILIGRKAKLPTFFLFLGILGGLQAYGFLGILFGPLIVTLLTAFTQIYREEYADRQDDVIRKEKQ